MRVLLTGGSGFIGTALVEFMARNGYEVVNIDKAAPYLDAHHKHWLKGDILDQALVREAVQAKAPDFVIHLAAETATNGRSLDDYRTNTDGTRNVVEAVKRSRFVRRFVSVSSQHVARPGSAVFHGPESEKPYKFYGRSKLVGETIVKEGDIGCIWTIIRPTTIWGPWHYGLARGLFKVMTGGFYLHPKEEVVRSYGYVRNVAWQIARIVEAPDASVNRRVLYVGDELVKQLDWVNGFSLALTGRKVRVVPRALVWALAMTGQIIGYCGLPFPIDRSRYLNMVTSNAVPIQETFQILGKPPVDFLAGIEETIRWLKEEGILRA
jgi:GlcNAc-P-P-Und epimerase